MFHEAARAYQVERGSCGLMCAKEPIACELNTVQLHLTPIIFKFTSSHPSSSLVFCFLFLSSWLALSRILPLILLGIEGELMIRHLHVLRLRELVAQRRYELGIYFQGEGLDLVDCLFEILLGVARELDDLLGPARCLFKLG